jgi:transposase
MSQKISNEVVSAIITDAIAGMSQRQIAIKHSVARITVQRILKRVSVQVKEHNNHKLTDELIKQILIDIHIKRMSQRQAALKHGLSRRTIQIVLQAYKLGKELQV